MAIKLETIRVVSMLLSVTCLLGAACLSILRSRMRGRRLALNVRCAACGHGMNTGIGLLKSPKVPTAIALVNEHGCSIVAPPDDPRWI